MRARDADVRHTLPRKYDVHISSKERHELFNFYYDTCPTHVLTMIGKKEICELQIHIVIPLLLFAASVSSPAGLRPWKIRMEVFLPRELLAFSLVFDLLWVVVCTLRRRLKGLQIPAHQAKTKQFC
jgi:hypothetical protein